MRKILMCFLLFVVTGCLDANRDFTKTCTKTVELDNYSEKIKLNINYNNKNEVTKIIMKKEYKISDNEILNSIKSSTSDFNKNLKGEKGVNMDVSDENSYRVIYTLEPKNMEEKNLDKFDIKINSVKYFKYLEKNNYKCL